MTITLGSISYDYSGRFVWWDSAVFPASGELGARSQSCDHNHALSVTRAGFAGDAVRLGEKDKSAKSGQAGARSQIPFLLVPVPDKGMAFAQNLVFWRFRAFYTARRNAGANGRNFARTRLGQFALRH